MSKYEVRVGDKVILREKEWGEVYPENAIVGKVYTIIPEDVQYGDLILDESRVQISIFTEYDHYEDFELYQTNTKVTDVEIGDVVEAVVLDSLQLNAYPEMTKFLGKRGVVKDKRAYLDVKFDDEVDTAIWAIHYHCVRVVEKSKPEDVLEPLPDSRYKPWDAITDMIKPTDEESDDTNISKLNVNLTVSIDGEQVAKQVQKVIDECVIEQPKPIQSDGGSSSYYDLPIPEELLNKILERKEEGKAYIKTEEIIRYFFDNDFSFGTALKSLVRGFGASKGGGKAGNDLDYEMNKVAYYADQIKKIK